MKPLHRRITPETKELWDTVDRIAAQAPFWAIIGVEREFGENPQLAEIEFEAPVLGDAGLYISLHGADILDATGKLPQKVGNIFEVEYVDGKFICKATVRKGYVNRIKEML